jgi:hypothetical protein
MNLRNFKAKLFIANPPHAVVSSGDSIGRLIYRDDKINWVLSAVTETLGESL